MFDIKWIRDNRAAFDAGLAKRDLEPQSAAILKQDEARRAILTTLQEAQSRRLYAHCGLEWTDAALNFHTQTSAVATPSAAQVRRPINRDAVARWRAHADALAPAAALLAAQGIAVDAV